MAFYVKNHIKIDKPETAFQSTDIPSYERFSSFSYIRNLLPKFVEVLKKSLYD